MTFIPGLRPKTKDRHDFKLGAITTLPKSHEIPLTDFLVYDPAVKNQGATYRCSGYGAALAIEAHESIPQSGDFLYGVAKMIEGDLADGAELRSVAKAATKVGSLAEQDWHESLNDDELKQWWNWLEKYKSVAVKHQQKTYFDIAGNGDFFDSIRSALWHYRNDKHLVVGGTTWFDGWTMQPIITQVQGNKVGGHAIVFIGQRIINGVPYLVIQNSGGEGIGERGRHCVSREVVNKYFARYGAFIFLDMTKEEAEAAMRQAKIGLLQKIISVLQTWLGIELSKKK